MIFRVLKTVTLYIEIDTTPLAAILLYRLVF